jgi:hypothetical protein
MDVDVGTMMFNFHESLMRTFFLERERERERERRIKRRCNVFHIGADICDFPLELEVPRPRVGFHGSIPLS